MIIDHPILTLIVFLPALGAMLCYVTGSPGAARGVALATSLVVLGLATLLLAGFLWPDAIVLSKVTTPGSHTYFAVEKSPWVPTLNVNYFFGADELSVILVFLNALLTPLALAISWDEHARVPEFFAMFLFMETTISGVFLSLDLFQFLVFWEVGLVPMYFLIAVWGGPRRRYAAIKFFLYTFLASLPLLVAVSSVSHMGFVTLGIAAGVYGFSAGGGYGRGAVLGFSGAIFQMFAHGLVSAALFMVAGSLGHKIGTRNISDLGGIAKKAPRFATFMMVSFLASLGLPGLVGFVAELSVFGVVPSA